MQISELKAVVATLPYGKVEVENDKELIIEKDGRDLLYNGDWSSDDYRNILRGIAALRNHAEALIELVEASRLLVAEISWVISQHEEYIRLLNGNTNAACLNNAYDKTKDALQKLENI